MHGVSLALAFDWVALVVALSEGSSCREEMKQFGAFEISLP